MLFKPRISLGATTLGLDIDGIMASIDRAVRVKAEQLTSAWRNRLVSFMYSSVRKRTGALDRAIKPFVLVTPSAVTLGFDIDLGVAPHIMSQVMFTKGESATKTVSAGSHMLTVPLMDHIYGYKRDSSLTVIPTVSKSFLGVRQGSTFKAQFVLEHQVKIPKRIKMYDIMDKFEVDAYRELQNTVQSILNK